MQNFIKLSAAVHDSYRLHRKNSDDAETILQPSLSRAVTMAVLPSLAGFKCNSKPKRS